jgi:hypothetical protein
MGNYAAALRDLEQAIRLAPSRADMLRLRDEVRAKAGPI